MSTRTDANGASLVLSQPMLLPWMGMFEQVGSCRTFIFYDDVQLPLGGGKGRGFSTRVQIKTERGIDWLSLPVRRAGRGKQLICEAEFAHMDWKQEHLSKLMQAYQTTPYFSEIFENVVKPVYALDTHSVSMFCMHSMRTVWQLLGFSPMVSLSSGLDISPEFSSSERVLEICKHFSIDTYISGLGAMSYIDYQLFEQAGVKIHYMNYRFVPYEQMHGPFTPYVSILDALFNVGIEGTRQSMASNYVYWKDWPHMKDQRPVKLTD